MRIALTTCMFVVGLITLVLSMNESARGGPFDGSLDPFKKGNNLGVVIQTPFKKPSIFQHQTNSPSGLNVMTWSVDEDGYILQSSRSDIPLRRTGSRAILQHYPNGRAYWPYDGKHYIAHHKYDNIQVQMQMQLELARQAEQNQRQLQIQTLTERNDAFLQIPPDVFAAEIRKCSDQELLTFIVGVQALIAETQRLGIPNSGGYTRLLTLARADVDRRFVQGGEKAAKELAAANATTHYAANLGIEYEVILLDSKTWGLKLTRDAAPGTPAGKIGLEAGDIIVELDGESMSSEQDVLMHVDNTTVKIKNVRDGSFVTRTTFIPQ